MPLMVSVSISSGQFISIGVNLLFQLYGHSTAGLLIGDIRTGIRHSSHLKLGWATLRVS